MPIITDRANNSEFLIKAVRSPIKAIIQKIKILTLTGLSKGFALSSGDSFFTVYVPAFGPMPCTTFCDWIVVGVGLKIDLSVVPKVKTNTEAIIKSITHTIFLLVSCMCLVYVKTKPYHCIDSLEHKLRGTPDRMRYACTDFTFRNKFLHVQSCTHLRSLRSLDDSNLV